MVINSTNKSLFIASSWFLFYLLIFLSIFRSPISPEKCFNQVPEVYDKTFLVVKRGFTLILLFICLFTRHNWMSHLRISVIYFIQMKAYFLFLRFSTLNLQQIKSIALACNFENCPDFTNWNIDNNISWITQHRKNSSKCWISRSVSLNVKSVPYSLSREFHTHRYRCELHLPNGVRTFNLPSSHCDIPLLHL